ncbi:MAG: hypothetical protein KKG84_03675 [Candidatus Omnitrophica bacterium]|nr:hypothetical protein [Candidatus Omnitrophota bacterium]
MLKRTLLTVLLAAAVISFGGVDPEAQEAPEKAGQERLSREDMMSRVIGIFQHRLDVLAAMPDLRYEKNPSGGIDYFYKGVKVEELDDEALFGLLKIVNSQVSWHNLQKLQKQLKDLKETEDINKAGKR